MAERLIAKSPRSYTTRDGEVKTTWVTVGSAWPTDAGGWRIQFDALPIPQVGKSGQIETTVVLMQPKDDDRPASNTSRRAPAPASDDDIPFGPEVR